jgi:hypothetical protein
MRMWNCWLVAMWIWATGRMKGYAWVRRSKAFHGLIFHYGHAHEVADHIVVVEYVPPDNLRWTKHNWVVLFRGSYKVTVMAPVAQQSFAELKPAAAWGDSVATKRAGRSSDRRAGDRREWDRRV